MKKYGIKRGVSFLLSLVMVLSLCLVALPGEAEAEEQVVLNVEGVGVDGSDPDQLNPGDMIDITVSLSGNNGRAYTSGIYLYYDPIQLEYKSITYGEGYGSSIFYDPYYSSDIKLSRLMVESGWKSSNPPEMMGVPLTDGVMFKARFSVKDTAKGAIAVTTSHSGLPPMGLRDSDFELVEYDVAGNASSMYAVTPINGISLDKTTLDLDVSGVSGAAAAQLTATIDPEDAGDVRIRWKSDDPAVAAVSDSGEVTAVGKGSTKITASAGGKSASCTVNVAVSLKGIAIQGITEDGNISDKDLSLRKGAKATLKLIYDPENAEHGEATWKSSDDAKVVIESSDSNQATVRAIADTGSQPVKITATVGDKKAEFSIAVQEVKLESIAIKEETTINRDGEETLEVTYNPGNTTDDRTVTWTSSDNSVATVDGGGKVTANKVGDARITAKVGTCESSCKVTVVSPLEQIVLKESSINLVKDQTQIIEYELKPEDTTDMEVAFSSSNPGVASVDAKGTVTANAEGTAVITLEGANSVTAAVTVTVIYNPIDSVTIDKKNAVVEEGDSQQLVGTIEPADTTDDTTINWESSDTSIVTVSPATTNSGEPVTVTAKKGGRAIITAKAGNGKVAECEIIVPIHLEGITVPDSVTMNWKDTLVLEATLDPKETTDKVQVTWTSNDETVASVNPENGTVTALKEGTAVITAKAAVLDAADGRFFEAETKVTVKENHLKLVSDQIKFNNSEESLLKNQSMNMNSRMNLEQLRKDYQITDDIEIKWSSSDEAVAAIDQSGLVTGLKEGSTTILAVITARGSDGKETGEYTVEVKLNVQEIPLESIAFDKVITEMQVGATDTLSIIYRPDNTTDLKEVQWSSSDSGILAVEDGKLTALKAGTAKITAKAGELSVTCEIKVTDPQTDKSPAVLKPDTTDKSSGGKNLKAGIKTGDTSNIALYLLFILASLAVIIVTGAKMSRRVRR